MMEQQFEELKHSIEEERKQHEKEREEMKAQISLLLEKHASSRTTHITNHIENQQNIHIHINAFGDENIEYLDDRTINDCIHRIYRSVPAILEKIHFDPAHPENHNIRITNKKLPYASIMGDNQKWKTVDKKDAIEKMVYNGYNILEDKYAETKGQLNPMKQQRFEEFKEKFISEDKELMKTLKCDTELLVING